MLNPQQHLLPLWAPDGAPDVLDAVAAAVGADVEDLMAWDLMLHDAQPAALNGPDGELLVGGRLDNLVSCFVAVEALAAAAEDPVDGTTVPVVCLYDHEEVGSVSRTGADGDLLPGLLARAHTARGRLERRPGPGPGRVGLRLGRHGPRHPSQLRRPARSRSTR